jgi:hypothetical protein
MHSNRDFSQLRTVMTRFPLSRPYLFLLLASGVGACSGLVAGPESSSVTPVPASRDSAFVRARRALQGESFTLDVVDSSGGRLTGTRWPSASARQGSSAACHVAVALQIQGDDSRSEVSSTSRWIAPGGMSDKAPQVCEQERTEVLERTAQVLAPPATP